jgi:hypothetical protein
MKSGLRHRSQRWVGSDDLRRASPFVVYLVRQLIKRYQYIALVPCQRSQADICFHFVQQEAQFRQLLHYGLVQDVFRPSASTIAFVAYLTCVLKGSAAFRGDVYVKRSRGASIDGLTA